MHCLCLVASSVPQPCVRRLPLTSFLTQAHYKSKQTSGVVLQGGAGIESDHEIALEKAFKAAEAACAQASWKSPGGNRCFRSPCMQPLGRQTTDLCLQSL